MDWMLAATAFAMFGAIVVVFVAAAAAVGYQARQRGYSFFLWVFASTIVINPVIFLVFLALMPNRKRKALRQQFRAELDAKLATQGRRFPGLSTFATAPPAVGSTLPVERSLGDLPTIAPPERSVGDEQTRD